MYTGILRAKRSSLESLGQAVIDVSLKRNPNAERVHGKGLLNRKEQSASSVKLRLSTDVDWS